jgi:hypothetical protein
VYNSLFKNKHYVNLYLSSFLSQGCSYEQANHSYNTMLLDNYVKHKSIPL